MPYGSVVAVAGVVVALLIGMISFWLVVRAVWPAWVERAEQRWSDTPGRSIGVGLLIGLLLIFMSAVFLGAPAPGARAIGLIIAGLSIGFAMIGVSALAARIGGGLASPKDAGREWMRTLKGGTALALSFLTPAAGQVLLALALFGGLGAAGLALMRRDGVTARENGDQANDVNSNASSDSDAFASGSDIVANGAPAEAG